MAVVVSDEQLLTRAAAGDERAAQEALERFTPLAMSIARDFFVPGGDADDVRQEAMIGVWKATRDWQLGHAASAKTFVALCVRRQLITAVKTATRVKHEFLSRSVRVIRMDDGDLEDVAAQLPQPHGDPAGALKAAA